MKFKTKELKILETSIKQCGECKEPAGPIVVSGIKRTYEGRCVNIYTHVNCYKPPYLYPLWSSHNSLEVKQFVDNWNQQFRVPEITHYFSEKPPVTDLKEPVTKYKRAWIEIFKWLRLEEVAELSRVSKEFYYYSWSAELWNPHLNFYVERSIEGVQEAKKAYVTCKFYKCVSCRVQLPPSKLIMCPLMKKPLCARCRKHPLADSEGQPKGSVSYFLFPILYLMKKYGVDRNFFEYCKIPLFYDKSNTLKTYSFYVEKNLTFYDPGKKHLMATRKRSRETN